MITTYWKNRAAGKRGQGAYPKLVTAIHHRADWPKKPVSKKARLKHTKRARKAIA